MSLSSMDPSMYTESKYHEAHHNPVRFTFVKLDIAIKDQKRLKEYLENTLGISIRVEREGGIAIFMSSQMSNIKCRKYFYDNFEKLTKNFNIRHFELSVDNDII